MFRSIFKLILSLSNLRSVKIDFLRKGLGLLICFLSFLLLGTKVSDPLVVFGDLIFLFLLFSAFVTLSVMRIISVKDLLVWQKKKMAKAILRSVFLESFLALFFGAILSAFVWAALIGTWGLVLDFLTSLLPLAGLLIFALMFGGTYPVYLAYSFWFRSAKNKKHPLGQRLSFSEKVVQF